MIMSLSHIALGGVGGVVLGAAIVAVIVFNQQQAANEAERIRQTRQVLIWAESLRENQINQTLQSIDQSLAQISIPLLHRPLSQSAEAASLYEQLRDYTNRHPDTPLARQFNQALTQPRDGF